MVLVEVDAVVVLATSVTMTTRVLAVLADTTVAGGHVPALLAVLVQTGRHVYAKFFNDNLAPNERCKIPCDQVCTDVQSHFM